MNTFAEIPPLSAWEQRLIALRLGSQMTAGDTKILNDQLDIDRCNQAELLMLACIGYEQGWDKFPAKIVPRLKGLHRYYQVHNTIRLPWLISKIRILRQAEIPVMLLKGLALRFYYASGNPRIMNDYDIAVPENLYDKAIRVLQSEEDTYLGCAPWLYHGIIKGKDRYLEVHSWIFKHHGEKNTDIWERATSLDFFGEDVLVPCPDDMLLHQLDNRSRDMFEHVFPNRTPIFLCDCCRIIQHMAHPDIARLAARARELHVTNSAIRMFPLLADYFPDLFSKSDINRVFPQTAKYRHWLKTGLKLQRASVRWQSYHYRQGDPMTPLRFFRSIARHYALCRMKTVEMKEMGYRYNFFIYCKELCQSGGVHTLLQRYKRPQPAGCSVEAHK